MPGRKYPVVFRAPFFQNVNTLVTICLEYHVFARSFCRDLFDVRKDGGWKKGAARRGTARNKLDCYEDSLPVNQKLTDTLTGTPSLGKVKYDVSLSGS